MFGDKTVLVTGGTGTFGSAFVKKLMDTATIFNLMLSNRRMRSATKCMKSQVKPSK